LNPAILPWHPDPHVSGIALVIATVGALLLSMLLSAEGRVIGSTLFRNRNRPSL